MPHIRFSELHFCPHSVMHVFQLDMPSTAASMYGTTVSIDFRQTLVSNPFPRVSSERLSVFAPEPAHYSGADRSGTVCRPQRVSWICSIVPCIPPASTLMLRCVKWRGCWKCRMIQFIRRTYSRATPENKNSTPSHTHTHGIFYAVPLSHSLALRGRSLPPSFCTVRR